MLSIHQFAKRFREILAALDDIAEQSGDEDLEELNAEFEDALFMLSEIDPQSEDAPEELSDALDEFDALAGDYARREASADAARRLGMLVQMLRSNASF